MKRYSWILLLLAFALCGQDAVAQRMTTVQGRVVNSKKNKAGKAMMPFTDEAVFVYIFNTIADAQDNLSKIDGAQGAAVVECNFAVCDQSGNYECQVPDNGALIFKVGMAPAKLEKVDGRNIINMALEGEIMLANIDVVAYVQEIQPKPKAAERIGNKFFPYNTFPIPPHNGRPNARLIIQPFIIDCTNDDTVNYCKPIVLDGQDYHDTQYRLMGFNWKHDPLYPYIQRRRLTAERMSIDWADTITIPHPDRNYSCYATIQMEDFTSIFFKKDFQIVTCHNRQPMRFLEYKFDMRPLDPYKYKEVAKREKRNTSAAIQLTFEVGKATLDPNNPENEQNIAALQNKLKELAAGEGVSIKEFHITGTASPEGIYKSNIDLAKKRVDFVQQQITSILPKYVLARVYQNPQAIVNGWAKVADAMEADEQEEVAEKIRGVIKNTKNMDIQGATIAKMEEYPEIQKYLPVLRSVKYDCKYEIFRELSPEEIWARYTEEQQTGVERKYALYEYWNLFMLEKDSVKLEKLYKRAYDESIELNGQPWILAANNLAISYLKRDTCDVTLLEPFIDRRMKHVNMVRKNIDGFTTRTINPEEVVNNQLCMYIKAYDFDNASVMAQILPNTPENQLMKAFALCLGGYYKSDKQVFETVKNSSPVNEVVMDLALDTKAGNAMAAKAAQKLDPESPVTWYLKAIIANRGGDMGYIDATQNLKKCFSMDEKYIKIAETDGDLDEDMVASTIDEYLEEKKMTAELNAQMEEQRKAEEAEAAKKAAEEAAAAAELEAAQKALEEEAAKKKAAEEAAAKKAPARKAPVKRTTTAKKK